MGHVPDDFTGSFALGLLATLAGERYLVAPGLRMMLTIGFLGSYTTFSTWTYETLALAEAGSFFQAAGNALGSLPVGLVAVWLGSRLARWTSRRRSAWAVRPSRSGSTSASA